MSELKFKFEDSQQYQLDAISAMTDIFTGAERADPVFAVVKGITDVGALPGMGDFGGFANPALTNLDAVRENVRTIQMRNGIFVQNEKAPLDSWKVKDVTLDGAERDCPHFVGGAFVASPPLGALERRRADICGKIFSAKIFFNKDF